MGIRPTGEWGLYLGRDTRLKGGYKYRWIRIGDSVRGLSEDGGGSIKEGVAITEPTFTGTTSTGTSGTTGTGSGIVALGYGDYTCGELQTEYTRLAGELAKLDKQVPTKWNLARKSLIGKSMFEIVFSAQTRNPL